MNDKFTWDEVLAIEDGDVRPIPDFPGYYAGPSGSIYSAVKDSVNLRKLSGSWDGESLRIGLRHQGGHRTVRDVHQIIACLFLPERPRGVHRIKFVDGNRRNCAASNLEWDTDYRYTRSLAAKLTADDVSAIRQMRADGHSLRTIARKFFVSHEAVNLIVNNKIHKGEAQS